MCTYCFLKRGWNGCAKWNGWINHYTSSFTVSWSRSIQNSWPNCGGSPSCASPCVTPLSIAQMTATESRSFPSDHTGLWQMAPDSLSGQHLPVSLSVPFCYVQSFSSNMEVTNGIFLNPYVHGNRLSHTVPYLQQVETMGSCIMTHHLMAPTNRPKL